MPFSFFKSRKEITLDNIGYTTTNTEPISFVVKINEHKGKSMSQLRTELDSALIKINNLKSYGNAITIVAIIETFVIIMLGIK